MEELSFVYPASEPLTSRAHVGVVASGDLEVLMQPSLNAQSAVTVTTSVNGFGTVWKSVLDRFFARFPSAAQVEINDFGATPGLVMLRLEQAAEQVRR